MRPKGSARELEVRRQIGARLLQEGKGVCEVARLVEASPSSVSRWKQALEEGGMEALKAKPNRGRRARLTPEQKKSLEQVLLEGPRAAGFATDLWTLARVAQAIEVHSARHGLELPEARAACPGARRGGHRRVAQERVAADREKTRCKKLCISVGMSPW
jgi:transposase